MTVSVSSDGIPESHKPPPSPSTLTWNSWFEPLTQDRKPVFKPVAKLAPQNDYLLTLDLAALSYGGNAAGSYSQLISAGLTRTLNTLSDGKKELSVLIIPEASAFDVQKDDDRYTSLWIDGKKIKRAVSHSFKIRKNDVFQELAKNAEPDFEFGRISVRLRTSSKTGLTHVLAVFWSNGLPIDEISIPVCIIDQGDQTCPSGNDSSYSLTGQNVGSALQQNTPTPDAALNFVELDSQHLLGVFRCNRCSEPANLGFRVWQMSQNGADLSAYLANTIITQFNSANSEDDYMSYGKALFNRVFRQASDGGIVPEASVLANALRDKGIKGAVTPPKLFVRFLASRPEPLFLAPIGLMVMPDDDKPLAQHFQVVVPLENQSYPSDVKCVGNWDVLAPSDDVGSWASDVNGGFGVWNTAFEDWHDHAHVFHDLSQFRTELSGSTNSNSADAILTVSHHAANKLFWDQESEAPSIDPDQVQISLPHPSLVILNGCGTQGPGQSEFVRQFNLRGASTLIASYYQVDTKLAGVFLANLLATLSDHAESVNYTISDALRDAQLITKDASAPDSQEKFGSAVYAYSLLGDPNLRACVPPISKKTSVAASR